MVKTLQFLLVLFTVMQLQNSSFMQNKKKILESFVVLMTAVMIVSRQQYNFVNRNSNTHRHLTYLVLI